MVLRIVTWNINSVRPRLHHVARLVEMQSPDVLCLQETKVTDALFPREALSALGFEHQHIHGQPGYNGVAVLSRQPFAERATQRWGGREEARHAVATLADGIELHSLYVPKGGHTPDPEDARFAYKLAFLDDLTAWVDACGLAARPVALLGDINIAPRPSDVWDHKRIRRLVGHTPLECARFDALCAAGGLTDAGRVTTPEPAPLYTWWGYRHRQAYAQGKGWRVDHALITESLAARLRACTVFDAPRAWERPSDHAPVILDLA